jgi:DNA-binding response OmpR family regulator
VHLRPKELEILRLLVLRRGRVLSPRQIVDLLYDGLSNPDETIIRVFVCGLRKKLAEHGAAGLVETVHGFGYVVNTVATSAEATMVPAPAAPLMEMRVH